MPRKKEVSPRIIKNSENLNIEEFRKSIRGTFAEVEDPRQPHRITYPLWYLLLVVLAGFLSGCNTIADLEAFGRHRHKWLVGMSGAAVGPPTYDTLWILLVRLKPVGLKALMKRWLDALPMGLRGKILAIDGKRTRGATYLGEQVHLVELVASDTGITITQERVPSKAGEVAALEPILEAVDVEGAILTMDALYTTSKVAAAITSKKADYILALKANQFNLHSEVQNFFDQAKEVEPSDSGVEYYREERTGHGRCGTVTVAVCSNLSWLPQKAEWPGLTSLVEVVTVRDNKQETRYFLSSSSGTAREFANWIRSHWVIENNVHWVADVIFQEDASKATVGNIQENMALFRRISMNAVREFDPGIGLADARRSCLHREDYLMGLLSLFFGKTF